MNEHTEMEQLNARLNDPEVRREYQLRYEHYRPSLLPRVLGAILVFCGNLVYGGKPSYLKFRAVEVIARVPYYSWQSVVFTLLSLFYHNEKRALRLAKISAFARHAQDNETMHVVVISHLAAQEQRAGLIRHTLIPVAFAFVYFWASYLLYLLNHRYSLELNYLFEQHAYDQYSLFLLLEGEHLRAKPVDSCYLDWYGRMCENQFAFFESVRNDELIHRNRSIEEISLVT